MACTQMPSGPSWFWFASRWQKWLWKRTKLLRDDIQWDIIFGLSCIKASLRTWMHIWEFGGAKNLGHRSAEMWTEVIWSDESSCTPQEVKHICGVQQEDNTGLNAGPPQRGDLGTLLSCFAPVTPSDGLPTSLAFCWTRCQKSHFPWRLTSPF